MNFCDNVKMGTLLKPKTIWSVIQGEIPEIEQHEVKTVLGLGLIEQVEEIMAEVVQ